MTLPKVKKKLIDVEEFSKNAKKVRKSLEEECRFLLEKKLKDANNVSPGSIVLS